MAAWLNNDPHVPGPNARPRSDSEIYRISASAPSPADPVRWSQSDAWLAGLTAYRHGYLWEAHEVWEAVWKNARPNSVEGMLVQGVIQLANAGLKFRMNKSNPASRLAEMASGHIHDVCLGQQLVVMGIDVGMLTINRRIHICAAWPDAGRLAQTFRDREPCQA